MVDFSVTFGSFGDWVVIIGLLLSLILAVLYRRTPHHGGQEMEEEADRLSQSLIFYRDGNPTMQESLLLREMRSEVAECRAFCDQFLHQRSQTHHGIRGFMCRLWHAIRPSRFEETELGRLRARLVQHQQRLLAISQALHARRMEDRIEEEMIVVRRQHEALFCSLTAYCQGIVYVDIIGARVPISSELFSDYKHLIHIIKGYYEHKRPSYCKYFTKGDFRLYLNQGGTRKVLTEETPITVGITIETSIILRRPHKNPVCPVCSSPSKEEVYGDWMACSASCRLKWIVTKEEKPVDDSMEHVSVNQRIESSHNELAYPDLSEINLLDIVVPVTRDDPVNSSAVLPTPTSSSASSQPNPLGVEPSTTFTGSTPEQAPLDSSSARLGANEEGSSTSAELSSTMQGRGSRALTNEGLSPALESLLDRPVTNSNLPPPLIPTSVDQSSRNQILGVTRTNRTEDSYHYRLPWPPLVPAQGWFPSAQVNSPINYQAPQYMRGQPWTTHNSGHEQSSGLPSTPQNISDSSQATSFQAGTSSQATATAPMKGDQKGEKQLFKEAIEKRWSGEIAYRILTSVAYTFESKIRSQNQTQWRSTAELTLSKDQTISRVGPWSDTKRGAENKAAEALRAWVEGTEISERVSRNDDKTAYATPSGSNRTRLDYVLSSHPTLAARKGTLRHGADRTPGRPDHVQRWVGWYTIENASGQTIREEGEERSTKFLALESAAGAMLEYVQSV